MTNRSPRSVWRARKLCDLSLGEPEPRHGRSVSLSLLCQGGVWAVWRSHRRRGCGRRRRRGGGAAWGPVRSRAGGVCGRAGRRRRSSGVASRLIAQSAR